MSLRKGILWSFTGVLVVICPGVAFAQLAPQSQEEFEQRFTGWTLETGAAVCGDDTTFELDPLTFIEPGRLEGSGIKADYEYEGTGQNSGTVTILILSNAVLDLMFSSRTMGTYTGKALGKVCEGGSFEFVESTTVPHTLYFPDYVDGGGWSVQLALSHIATATEDAEIIVTAYDREGQPIPGFFDPEGPFGIPPLGTRILRSAGPGERRRGWIEVRTDTASVSGLLTYRNTETGLEVSVEPVELGNHFALFVEESSGIGTGLAIFKPDPSSTIEFRIYGEDGINPFGEEFVTHPIEGRTFQQAVLSIARWYAIGGIDTEFLSDFRGLLLLRSEDNALFAPIGIRFGRRGESLSAIPVIMPSTLAPADQAAFDAIVVGKRILSGEPNFYVDFISPGRFRETENAAIATGSYTYRNTGPNTGTVTFNYDDGSGDYDRCAIHLTFALATMGTGIAVCDG